MYSLTEIHIGLIYKHYTHGYNLICSKNDQDSDENENSKIHTNIIYCFSSYT